MEKEKTERILIERINGVDIYAVKDENGKELVPIKPICEALRVLPHGQQDKIKSHPIYNSVAHLSCVTGADGKQYEMLCIEAEFVYGWLLGINPDNVSEHVRDNLIKYQIECHHALYRYFHGRLKRHEEYIDLERSLIKEREEVNASLSELTKSISEFKSRMKTIDGKLQELQEQRLNPTPSLFD